MARLRLFGFARTSKAHARENQGEPATACIGSSNFRAVPSCLPRAVRACNLQRLNIRADRSHQMSLRDKISSDLKTAMKTRDTARLATLRLINAAIKDREIATRGEQGSSEVTDADLTAVLTRMVKQRRDSARAYEEAARLDLAEKETAEIAVIESFLPRQLSDEEMAAAIEKIITQTGASSVRDIGKVMAVLKASYAGQMDFGKAGARVKQKLA
jgi:uncharacterized protein YqeY